MTDAAHIESDDDSNVVIKVRELKKVFGTQTVLDGVNLDIRRGETLVVMIWVW